METKNSPARALAAYYRELARHTRGDLPLDTLPSWICEEALAERDDVIVCHGSRTLAVYRVRTDSPLRRLKRWPQRLRCRQRDTGQPWPRPPWSGEICGRALPRSPRLPHTLLARFLLKLVIKYYIGLW
jgi:hypothetical protein